MAEDFYKILGVNRNASQAEIQKAYRDLARKYHPDLNPEKGATKKFQEIQRAFEVLNDPQKREMYDRYGSSFETMGSGGPRGAGPWPSGGAGAGGFGGFPGAEEVDFSQFLGDQGGVDFGELFGRFRKAAPRSRKSGGGQRRKGADVESELTIPFGIAISGGEVQLQLRRPDGSTETIAVKIPAGIEEGKKVRLRGQGEPGAGKSPPGDLLLTVHVAPHPYFQRKGDHLLVRVPVTLAEAALGAKVDVPTPKGTVTLRVPPGTSSGAKLRIKGHGVAPRNGTAGDLLAEILILLPKEFDANEQEAIRQLDQKHPLNPRSDLRW